MDYTTLGSTGLKVSVAGLGCGGNSRLGLATGRSEAEAVRVVRGALEAGVNFFDTAAVYGTEEVVGRALKDVPRDQVVISTKAQIRVDGRLRQPEEVTESLEASLKRLGMDHVDLFHLHGVHPDDYEVARDQFLPAVAKAKEAGKCRHIGITETGPRDPQHLMLERALGDDHFDGVMVAFHMMNQNTREKVFPLTRKHHVGTLVMFAVRSLFSQPGRLQRTMAELAAEGKVPNWLAERDNPLDWVIEESGASDIIEAAYRYVRHEPGVDVVLFGTGNPAHVPTNVRSILAPPLPDATVARINELFGGLEGVGLDFPIHHQAKG